MKKRITLSLTALIAAVLASCGGFGGPSYDLKKGVIGMEGTDAKDFIVEKLLKTIKVAPEGAEISDIQSHAAIKDDGIYSSCFLTVDLVRPSETNKVDSYMYHSTTGWSNVEVTFSDNEGNIAKTYEEFSHMLFKLSDIEIFLNNMSSYLKTALEKSEYGKDGSIGYWSINRNSDGELALNINVKYKASMTSKYFTVNSKGEFNK